MIPLERSLYSLNLGAPNELFTTPASTLVVEIKLNTYYDQVSIEKRSKAQMIEKQVKLGAFSHVNSGEDSEESRIIKAWHDLIEEAQIIDKKQVLQDFDNLLTKQWPCNILGCYLSKYLQVPRAALKVFAMQ